MYVYTYSITSRPKTCFDQSPAANARRGDERVRVSKPYIPVSSSPPVAPEGLEKAESTLPMDLAREASTAAPRDEARDLWERFGQVAPPPPRTLVVVKRPQPMRRSDGSKTVALHPSEAASYCESYNAGGGELYLTSGRP